MAFAGVRAFCGTGCCATGCQIGVDTFDAPDIGPEWQATSGAWSQSAGALHGENPGAILYQPHGGATEPIKLAVSLTPKAGSPAIARVAVAASDEDNYVFAEVRIVEAGCGWLQLGRRRAGEDTYLAEAVPLYENARELDDTLTLAICWLPSEAGSTIQVLTSFSGPLPDEIGETTCSATERGQQGIVWSTATISAAAASDGINTAAERASVIAARRMPWLRRALPQPPALNRRGRAQAGGAYAMLPAGRGVSAAMTRRLPWLRRFQPGSDSSIGRQDRATLAASARSLATSPLGLLTGLVVVSGEWDFPSWRIDFHRNPPDHTGCPRCAVDCFLFEDCFGRPVADDLGCHWFEVEGQIPIEEIDFGVYGTVLSPVITGDEPAMAISRHATTAPENNQFIHLLYGGPETVTWGITEVSGSPLADQKVAIIFGASADGTDYYRAEVWYEGDPGPGGVPVQWRCRLLHNGDVLATADSQPDYWKAGPPVSFDVCYENGYVLVSLMGGGVAGYVPNIGLRYYLGPIEGRYAGVAGDPGIRFVDFRFHQSPVFDPEEHPLSECKDCIPYKPPCSNCINDDAPEILMATLAGATIGAEGVSCGVSGDINGNYLAFAEGMITDCCQWIGCPTPGPVDFFVPNVSDCCSRLPIPGQVTVWGPQCRINNADLWTDNCFTRRDFIASYNWREYVCARVYGMLSRIGINGSQIWAVYTFVNAIYFEETMPDTDVFGNPVPNPDEVIDRTGPFCFAWQQVIFQGTLPDPLDCPNLDVTLTPVPDQLDLAADYCLFGDYFHIRNFLYDFTSATLRIRAAAL